MANNTDLTFIVDTTQLDKAFKKAGQIETQIKKLAKAQASGGITTQQYSAQVSKLASQLQEQVKGNIAARNSINAYSKATLEAAKANSEAAKTAAKQERALEALKTKYNPAYRGAQQFKNALREINVAHEKGAISSARHAEQVDRLKDEYRQFLSGTAGWSNQFVQGANRAGKSVNKFGMYTQQFGYQMSDFLVQVQGGTNMFVAFGQQGAQLFGLISGPWGAALSIGAAAVGAFGASWMKAREQMKEAQTGAKDLQDRVESLTQTVKTFRLENKAGLLGNTLDEQVILDSITQVEEKIAKLAPIVEEFKKTANFSTLGFNALTGFGPENDLAEYQKKLTELYTLLGQIQEKQEKERVEEQTEFEKEAALEAIKAKEEAMQEYWHNYITEMNRVIAAEKEAYEDAQEVRFQSMMAVHDSLVEDTKELEAQDDILRGFAKKIAEAYNKGEALHDLELQMDMLQAADAALLLAQRLGISVDAARQLVTEAQLFGMNFGVGLDPNAKDLLPPQYAVDNAFSSRGGGSRKKETAEEYLEKLQREIDFKESLLELSADERTIATELNRLKEQVISKDLKISEKTLEKYVREEQAADEALEKLKERERLEKQIFDSIGNELLELVKGAQSIEEAFKNMIFNILESIYKAQVVDPLTENLGTIFKGILKQADGGAWSGGVQMFAKGGVVNAPTMFGHSGGLGVMGEAGPEAIMPLKRGRDGKLGVSAQGNSGGTTSVVVSLSPELVAQVLQQAEANSVQVVQSSAKGIVNASVKEVMKQRRQGGAMKATFG